MAYDPFLTTNPIVGAFEQHRGKVEQTRENTARLAQSFGSFETRGDGEFILSEAHLFGCTFTERPVVSYGYSLTEESEPPLFGRLPQCVGGVSLWITNPKGFYVGAYTFFVVNCQTVLTTTPPPEGEDPPPVPPADQPTPIYIIEHDMTFTGIALKDLPDYLLEPGGGSA
jgi:hypothetical protein